MKTKISLLFLVPGLVFILGCTKYPPSSERLLEDLVVITQYDTKVDFNTYKTYTITDNIVKVTDRDTTTIQNSLSDAILAQIDKNMQARGFVKSTPPLLPDLGIDVIYYQDTYVYAYYGGWWGYSYYYYYPYYPVYYSSYTAGMANIELIDLKNPDIANNRLYLRWNAYIRGLMTGDHTQAEILTKVDQAFTQTPQLVTSSN